LFSEERGEEEEEEEEEEGGENRGNVHTQRSRVSR